MAALLLDTHVLLWANAAPERLSVGTADALEDPANELFVSSISVAEIEIKRALGNLTMKHRCLTLASRLGANWADEGRRTALAQRLRRLGIQ